MVDSFTLGFLLGIAVCALPIIHLKRACAKAGQEARTDALTGLSNKRNLDIALGREIAAQRRSAFMDADAAPSIPPRGSIGVIAIDLDGFKPINDLHGHVVGDDALRIVAQAIRSSIRGSDIASRTGGDEFVIMLRPNRTGILTMRDVAGVARKIAENLEEMKLSYMVNGDRVLRSLRISVGATVFLFDHASTWTPSGILTIADQAMYEAKRGKENRKHNIRTAVLSPSGEVLRQPQEQTCNN